MDIKADRKNTKQKKAPRVHRKIRFSEAEANRIQLLADHYAGGNFSKWIRYAALNCPRKDIK